ncbi:VOC family protein [Pseudomonas sp. Z18(2022)]|uniref:VOC family protein n=1 Tax=Pseudomonas sp. Z18(2022) TaxID=2983410 RepID=UPI002E803D77|nr:VOC family protein [Pseudomonas sp. Z18(2022)]
MSLEHDQLAGIVNLVAPPQAFEMAERRRANTRIKRLHHHAFFTKDVEATRHFYEDILELKMVLALVDEGDLHPNDPTPTPFLHIFFEMGDGSMIAFFEAVPIHSKRPFPELTIFDHHFSVKVDDSEAIAYIKDRLEKAGYKTFEMDHGFCHSLYVEDPNGLHLEFSCNTREYEDYFARAETVSHDLVRMYLANRARDRDVEAQSESA